MIRNLDCFESIFLFIFSKYICICFNCFGEHERYMSRVMAKSRNPSKEQEQELSGLLNERP